MLVNVPRIFYVDVDLERRHHLSGARQVDRTLPDGCQATTLLELQMSEEDFLTNSAVCYHKDGKNGTQMVVSQQNPGVPEKGASKMHLRPC
jgi:hypothetical protein